MRYGSWIGILGIVLWCAGMISPATLQAASGDGYTLADLELKSAGDLVDVCTLETGHDDHTAARAFCYGFFEGATRYDDVISRAPDHVDLVCSPTGTTRAQAVQVFITYINNHPQYRGEMPIDAIFRALVDKWPCKK